MSEYLTPGVYFEFLDAAPPLIRQTRTDIAGFVGLAERGPLNTPVQINSLRQFQAVFGSFVAYGYLAYAVKGFFENGGRAGYVVRVAGWQAARAELALKTSLGADLLRIQAANEGAWGNRLQVTLVQVRPSALAFSLTVTWDQREYERFPDLSLLPGDARYFARMINAGDARSAPSRWITVEDLLPAGASRQADSLPDPQQAGLVQRAALLSGGQDGLASLTVADFLGESDPLRPSEAWDHPRSGLAALDAIDPVGIVCIPDIHIRPEIIPLAPPAPTPPHDPCLPAADPALVAPAQVAQAGEQPPLFDDEAIFTVQQAMIEHCERNKDRVAILDLPLRPGGATRTLSEALEWRNRFDSQRGFAALYYPWLKVVDPRFSGGLPLRLIPPCGHVAGLYARSDFNVGVHKAPANAELFWAEDVTALIDDETQAVLNPEGINCLRPFPGRGIRVYGARTVSSDPDWRYVNVRRLLIMIEEAIDEATQWAVFEPHDFNLRQTLTLSVSSFLETVWRQGGLAGATKEESYYVKCDDANNPPESVDQGRLVVEVGVAPTIPAEFVIFRVGRTIEELEIVER